MDRKAIFESVKLPQVVKAAAPETAYIDVSFLPANRVGRSFDGFDTDLLTHVGASEAVVSQKVARSA